MSGEDKLAAAFVVVMTLAVLGAVLWAKRGRTPDEMRALSYGVLRNRYPIALLGTGGLCAVLGVGMMVHTKLIEVQPLDPATLEAGGELDASFVEVRGHARPEARFCRSGRQGRRACYTPIVAGPDSERVGVLLAADAPSGMGQWSGFISRSNQPSFRREVEALGLEPATDLVRVLPESRTDRANAGAWISLGGVSLLCFGWVWMQRLRAQPS